MPKCLSAYLLIGAFVAGAASASAETATTRWTRIDRVAGFDGWHRELQRLVDDQGHDRINHFCVVAERLQPPRGPGDIGSPAPEIIGRVYWREGHRLIGWDAGLDGVDAGSARSQNDLDLTKDVRATQAGVGTSTYLVTRAWVGTIIRECAQHGTSLVVVKGKANA